MTREYAGHIIYTLSEEQFDKITELIQKFEEENRNNEKPKEKRVLKARGIFHECANPEMIPGEKGAWERAVVEKYAKQNKDLSQNYILT